MLLFGFSKDLFRYSSFHLLLNPNSLSLNMWKHIPKARQGVTTSVTMLGRRNFYQRNLSPTPVTVAVTSEEVVARKLGWHNLELATRALHRDGLVVLQDVIEHSKLNALNTIMVEDALRLRALGDAGRFNYNKGYGVSHDLKSFV